jgi:hypothetical protein
MREKRGAEHLLLGVLFAKSQYAMSVGKWDMISMYKSTK